MFICVCKGLLAAGIFLKGVLHTKSVPRLLLLLLDGVRVNAFTATHSSLREKVKQHMPRL